MIYFIAQDVSNKLRIRNAQSLYTTYGLYEGRDYIKFSAKMNRKAFNDIINMGIVDKNSTVVYILTLSGVMELLYKSKDLDAKRIKDDVVGNPINIMETQSYKLVGKVVAGLSPKKREQFYNDSAYAYREIQEVAGAMSEELKGSVDLVRYFANGVVKSDGEIPDINIGVLLKEFKYFYL